jgi:hypothetical protein
MALPQTHLDQSVRTLHRIAHPHADVTDQLGIAEVTVAVRGCAEGESTDVEEFSRLADLDHSVIGCIGGAEWGVRPESAGH